jgi:hypothetical protein
MTLTSFPGPNQAHCVRKMLSSISRNGDPRTNLPVSFLSAFRILSIDTSPCEGNTHFSEHEQDMTRVCPKETSSSPFHLIVQSSLLLRLSPSLPLDGRVNICSHLLVFICNKLIMFEEKAKIKSDETKRTTAFEHIKFILIKTNNG